MDGAEAHGYVHMPPVVPFPEHVPSKLCRLTAHLADKAYASAGEAVSVLHSMAVLQVFQAKRALCSW